jgi:ketosteroid isomerase-like protein
MSAENLEIVRRSTALLNARDWDELFDLYDPEVEFCDLRSAVDTPRVLRGVETVRSLLIAWTEAWEDFGAEVYEYIDADPM